ncbi:AcvB/VirJ family lysyl-phosphatidylglycerol hydrolase, partial [Burkholderia cenocepacia]
MMSKKGIARAAAACAGMMLAGAACATQPAAVKAETVSGGRYGPVTVTRPSGPLRGFVVLFSREGGWRAADQQAADALAKAGAMTVGVDSARYAANLAAKQETCH